MVIDKIENGIVLDHIRAGNAMVLYRYLRLDELDCCVAIIKNVKSQKMGRKEIHSVHLELRGILWLCQPDLL